MSYGVLADPCFLDEFTKIWRQHRDKLYSTWSRASYRMRYMALHHVAVLRAIGEVKPKNMDDRALKTCLDILELHGRIPEQQTRDGHAEEVRDRLTAMGLSQTAQGTMLAGQNR